MSVGHIGIVEKEQETRSDGYGYVVYAVVRMYLGMQEKNLQLLLVFFFYNPDNYVIDIYSYLYNCTDILLIPHI